MVHSSSTCYSTLISPHTQFLVLPVSSQTTCTQHRDGSHTNHTNTLTALCLLCICDIFSFPFCIFLAWWKGFNNLIALVWKTWLWFEWFFKTTLAKSSKRACSWAVHSRSQSVCGCWQTCRGACIASMVWMDDWNAPWKLYAWSWRLWKTMSTSSRWDCHFLHPELFKLSLTLQWKHKANRENINIGSITKSTLTASQEFKWISCSQVLVSANVFFWRV